MKLVVIDLDCTLADTREVVSSGGPEPVPGTPEHEAWVNHVTNPSILSSARVVPMVGLVTSALEYLHKTIFLTNRRESMRELTQAWLDERGFSSIPLLMRPEGLLDSAGVFKEREIKSLVKDSKDVLIIDDDPCGTIEEMCKRNGWTHFKVTSY